MPNYGALVGKHVVVDMTEANFESVAPSVRYTMKVSVKNVSMRGQRVRLIPPKNREFTLVVQNDVELAPGLVMQAELQFYSDVPEDIENEMVVLVGRADSDGEHLTIPVRSTLPAAKIVLDASIDFGVVLLNSVPTRKLVVTNQGTRDGKIMLGPLALSEMYSIKPPIEATIKPGDSHTYAIELNAAEVGKQELIVPVAIKGQMAYFPLPTELALAADVRHQNAELRDVKEAPLAKSELGRLYCGLTTTRKAFILNHGPKPINFAVSKTSGDESGGPPPEEDPSMPCPLVVEPMMGRIPAGGRLELTLAFCPARRSPTAPKGFFASGETEEIVTELTQAYVFEILETGQKLPLRLEGIALAPRVALSQGAFTFGSCDMYDHREAYLTLTNKQELPYAFSFTTPAHFAAKPLEGTVPPMGEVQVCLSFAPHQLGKLVGALQLLGFGGRVGVQTIKLHGECTAPATRPPAGGTDKLPEDFEVEPNVVEQCSFLPRTVNAKWVRPPAWEMSEALQGGKVQTTTSSTLTPIHTLTKKRTYRDQMAKQPVLDAIDQMDTGLELPAAALKAQHEHREYYAKFLKNQRAQREARNKAQHQAANKMHSDPEAFLFGCDLGLDPYSGIAPFAPPLPQDLSPLFLFHPYTDGETAKSGPPSALFDPFRLTPKKHKSKPESLDEVADCKATLSADELKQITGGPKTVDFGNISVYTQVARNFTVLNELRANILVAIELGDEIKQCPPQVIPPGGTAGFDLFFSSDEPTQYQRTITYTVNGAHAFRFVAKATVEPIEVSFSTEELQFRFADGVLEPSMSASVAITNHGTYPARFRWENPESMPPGRKPAFVPASLTGEIPPKKTLPVEIIFTPYLGCAAEHVLTAIVEGGSSKTLFCKGDVTEAKASLTVKRVEFGVVPAGIVKEKNFLIKKQGQTTAVFTFDPPPPGFSIKPQAGAVRVGQTMEVSVEVLAIPPRGERVLDLAGVLKCDLRCGKPIKLAVHVEARAPDVNVLEDELNFGRVVAGATKWHPLTLKNVSIVPALLHLDLTGRQFADLEVKVQLDPVAEAEAEARAAADDRATTIVPDEEQESPLQLLSQPSNASPPPTAGMSADETGDGDGEVASPSRPKYNEAAHEERRLYAITVQPQTTLALKLGYTPKAASELLLELPLTPVGLAPEPALRKVVVGEGLKARLKLSTSAIKFGDCILRAAQFPYTKEITITNTDDKQVEWMLDENVIPDESGFSLDCPSGTLQVGESFTITFGFAATTVGIADVMLPLCLDGGNVPYLTPRLMANAVLPRLTFDRPELILPTVPLGHTAKASLYLINEGYDNLQVQYKLPLDDKRAPLTLEFPEGQLVGVSKKKVLITVSFASDKPTSFTANIDLIDTDGNRFSLPVTATSDNSVLTVQPYLDSVKAQGGAGSEVIAREGKAPSLVVPIAPPAPPPDDMSKEAKQKRVALAQACFLPPKRTHEQLAKAASSMARGASIVLAYVSSALMAMPAPPGSGASFPAMLTANKGAVAYELLALVSGKSVPVPEQPSDRKNEKALLRHLVQSYDQMIQFLRAHGAMCASLKAEQLLPLDEYLKLVGGGAPLSRKERKAVRDEHAVFHSESWLELLFQAIRTFVLGRVTLKAFRGLPGMAEAAGAISKEVGSSAYRAQAAVDACKAIQDARDKKETAKDKKVVAKKDEAPPAPLPSSLLYSTSELLLLRWLEYHSAVCPELPFGGGNPLDEVGGVLDAFDKELKDGHVFARVIISHCPFLATIKADNPPLTSSGDVEIGTAIDNLYPRPCSPAQAAANLGIVVQALAGIGLRFAASAGMPPLEPSELYAASPREMALFALFLYQHMPHYVPKAVVGFTGGIHQPLARTIELANPAKKPIIYEVRLEGPPAPRQCFKVGAREVRIEGKSTLPFPVNVLSFFIGQHTGRLIFLSKGNGVDTANASTLVFDLLATIDIGLPLENFSTVSKLYQPQMLTVKLTNPFDVPAAFKLSFTETRPEIALPKLGGGGGGDKGGKPPAAAPAARSAKIAGIEGSLKGGAASAVDSMTKKLPNSFFCAASTVSVDARGTASMQVQFLPFQLGEYTATVLYSDENVGELSYQLKGTVSMPLPLETLTFASEADSTAGREVQLPFRNPQVEKARQMVLDRSQREKERMGQIWGKEPMLRGPVQLQLAYGSAAFSGQATIELVDNEKRRGGGNKSTAGSVAGSGAATPKGKDSGAPPATASADANKLPLRFVPKEPGQYTSELLLISPLDVRLYDLAGACAAPGVKAALEFVTPARMPLRQELPVINGTQDDWTISAAIKGEGFHGPASVKIPAGQSGSYPLDFTPDWITEVTGECILTNQSTGDKYVFTLKGIGEEPLAEGNVVIECAARKPKQVPFTVYNVIGSGEPCTLKIETDLLHVQGPSSVSVPKRAKGSDPTKDGITYMLTVNSQMGGELRGSITFTTPDGRYLWYTVEMHSDPPPCEKHLRISAPLRKVIAVEIPIANPTNTELEFQVIITGEGLLGDDSVRVAGDSEVRYELLFSPLIAGTSAGQISFVNPHAGEFWYELTLTGEPTEPVDLPKLRAAVGASATHEVTVSNPVGEELPLQLRVEGRNPKAFTLQGPKTGPGGAGALLLPPYGELTCTLTYTPSALDEEQSAMLALTHPKLGEWLYRAKGMGHAPSDMPVTRPSAPLGHTTSGSIALRNPFDQPLVIDLALEQSINVYDDPGAMPPFELLARRTSGVTIAPGTSVQFPFSFVARDMSESHAAIVLHGDYKGRHLTWRYPLVGEAISRPLHKPIALHVAARQPLTRELALPLPGLQDTGVDEPFTYELDLDAQSAGLIESSLTLTPLQRTLSGSTLTMAVDWRPLRPVRTSAALVVRKNSGGRWRYDLTFEAGEPAPDDVIYLEAPIHKTAQVQFKLCNAFDDDAAYTAYFSADSASVFSVNPMQGVLPRAGTAGALFTVAYTPAEYGKPVRGTLIILTEEMQWSYEVRGGHPPYEIPRVAHSTIDHVLDPSISMRLGKVPTTNFMKKNMQQQH